MEARQSNSPLGPRLCLTPRSLRDLRLSAFRSIQEIAPHHIPLAVRKYRAYACGVSHTDHPAHGWLRRAVTHPDFAARLATLATGEGELVLDHAAEASHAFLAALVCEAAKDRHKSRALAGVRHPPPPRTPRRRDGTLGHQRPGPARSAGRRPATAPSPIPSPPPSGSRCLEILARAESCTVLCGSEAFAGKAPSPAALRASPHRPANPAPPLDPAELANIPHRSRLRARPDRHRPRPVRRARRHHRPLRLAGRQTAAAGVFRHRSRIHPRVRSRFAGLHHQTARSRPAARRTRHRSHRRRLPTRRRPDRFLRLRTSTDPTCASSKEPPSINSEEDFTLATFGSPLGTFEAGDFVLGGTPPRQLLPPAQRVATRRLGHGHGLF